MSPLNWTVLALRLLCLLFLGFSGQHPFCGKGCMGEAPVIEFLSSEDFKSFADGYYLQSLNKWENRANGRL